MIGRIRRNEWKTAQLGDVIELFDSQRVPLNSRERQERKGKYPYYGAQGVIDHIDGYIFDGRYILVAEDGENLNSRKLPLAMFATGKFWANNHAHILRGKPGVADDTFLLACLNNVDIKPFVTGAAQPKLSQANMRLIEVPLPPLPVQQRIAGILSAYDELIENCERRIRVLDEMARALYREWFVLFRYPGHEKVPLVDSPLGRIPKGWIRAPASAVLEINPKVGLPRAGERPFVPMGSLSSDTMVIADIETREVTSGAKFQNGDTLFARITPCLENGKTGFVQFLPDPAAAACGSTEFIVLRGRTVPPEYVYCLARSEEFRSHAIKSMSGATGRQRVQERCFEQFFLPQPQPAVLSQFAEITRPAFGLTEVLHRRIVNLRETRDLLLPRLLSGQLSVEATE